MNDTPNQTSGIPSQWQNSGGSLPPVMPVGTPPPNPTRHTAVRTLFGVLISAILAFVVVLNQSVAIDYITAHVYYTPTATVKTLAGQLDMTSRAQDIFYASNPTISDSSSNFPCKSDEGSSVILGCYSTTASWFDPGTIYVLNVKNDSLDGVMQVTAAHEMLHAAYARLNIIDKPKVDAMVRAEYNKIKDDADIKEEMAYYKSAEPGQDINELHSIIGTTVKNLDPELEAYYGRYFTDRAAIVEHYQQYSQALHKNDEQIKALESKLKTESQSLELDMTQYQTDLRQLNLDIESFNERATSGGFASRSAFETARAALMTRVDAMNAQAESLNARVKAYNADVQTLNSLSAETQDLYSSLKGVEAPTSV